MVDSIVYVLVFQKGAMNMGWFIILLLACCVLGAIVDPDRTRDVRDEWWRRW